MKRSRMLLVAAAGFVLASCGGGGGGSNDNGVAFRFLGVFQETQEQLAPAADSFDNDNPTGETGAFITLGVTEFLPTDRNNDGDLDGGYLGFQNDLDQSLNIQSVHVEVFIPGAKLNNPVVTDSVPLSITLPAAGVDDSGERIPSKIYAQTVYLAPDVLSFLAGNQTLLPTPPFNMTVAMRATAISDSGDSFDTNEINFDVVVFGL